MCLSLQLDPWAQCFYARARKKDKRKTKKNKNKKGERRKGQKKKSGRGCDGLTIEVPGNVLFFYWVGLVVHIRGACYDMPLFFFFFLLLSTLSLQLLRTNKQVDWQDKKKARHTDTRSILGHVHVLTAPPRCGMMIWVGLLLLWDPELSVESHDGGGGAALLCFFSLFTFIIVAARLHQAGTQSPVPCQWALEQKVHHHVDGP
ncbi:hypothetical protein IF1G_07491 [Cordyceps javanica]|uniref:Uncharacterized protein n=1 Tax=Cordyceps javanica TaxID=43265 RepID=A0A545UWC5_9HYPO|nr:hypothetical protein IF1G_07491 [Cordyceps javanica]